MFWGILSIAIYCGLHFGLYLPLVPAAVIALIVTAVVWGAWKLRWFIVAIVGLEFLFGERQD